MGRLFDLRKKFESKALGVHEFYRSEMAGLRERNEKTNALLEIFEDEVLEKSKALDNAKDRSASLFGLPVAIKDMISIAGHELTASSKILRGYRPQRSATVTEKLERDGAVFVGRANCDEFAMGSSNENTPYGCVRNPHDLSRTAGGSSGGSAAAVAAGISAAALGTDTGGSIRLPAAFCGITGLKPTYGRVSRSGVIAFASSLDQVGPLADDAIDCAMILQSIAGRDPRDATSMPTPTADYVKACQEGSLKGLKIGLPKEYFQKGGVEAESQKAIDATLEVFKKEGAILRDVSIPHTPYGIAVYYLVATAEAASNLARYDGIRYGKRAENFSSLKDLIQSSRSEGFGTEVKRRIMLGTFSLSSGYYDAYYQKAQFVRSKLQKEFLSVLSEVDVLFTPVAPTPAFEIGSKVNDPLQMYLSDVFTVSINLAGVPAIAFPIGATSKQLPIGGQFIGAPFDEARLLQAVAAFERTKAFTMKAAPMALTGGGR